MSTAIKSDTEYQFFTPYYRGRDLVFDFLCAQPEGQFSANGLTVKASHRYERSRNLDVFAGEQQVAHGAQLWDRFAAMAPVFQLFWNTLEQAATDWKLGGEKAEELALAEQKRRDDALCAQVLAAAAAAIKESMD